ncbi:MAG: response regulator transcription factor [Thermoflexales bacterium]|nr:response regulator transcription factor [Thermoflexales bacterium]
MSISNLCFTILLLEPAHGPYQLAIEPMLSKKGYTVVRVATPRQAIDYVKQGQPTMAVLDCTNTKTACQALCHSLHIENSILPILLIQAPDAEASLDLPATVTVLVQPFTARKLFNRIKALLPQAGGDVLYAGPLTLYLQRKCLKRGAVEYRLTPMKMRLIEVFMRHPDKVLSRRFLIKEVWDTDYVGDTRTLDVHIRWLRQIIEDDPSQPVCLKTVRGVGYRFNPTEPRPDTPTRP